MTYGNTSWNEFAQTYVDISQDLLNKERKEANEWARDENVKLKEKLKDAEALLEESEQVNYILKARAEKASKEAEAYKSLLSRPMFEIAQQNGDFKQTFQDQQLLLARWIMSQKAYKETATQLGIQLGKTPEEVKELNKDNIDAVLENRTEHGNDASSNELLNHYADTIIKIRKSKNMG